jgi:hypothetical protein
MGKGIKRVAMATATLGFSEVYRAGDAALNPDLPGAGASAAQLAAEALNKSNKITAQRAAAMARNKTAFASVTGDDEAENVYIPSAGKSIYNKKKLG